MDDNLFCTVCFNILDLSFDTEIIVCDVCGNEASASIFENRETVSHSHSISLEQVSKTMLESSMGGSVSKPHEGATIKEKCPKCQHPEMTFHTMQLRSADEGQTVFYVCLACNYKYSVNT